MVLNDKKKLTMFILLILISVVILSQYISVKPSKVICKESKRGTPYCLYQGEIKGIYLNKKDDLILIFLEEEIKAIEAHAIGYAVKDSNAVAISISSDFSTLSFDLLNDAFVNGYYVKIHARGVYKGYLSIDRIWVNKQ